MYRRRMPILPREQRVTTEENFQFAHSIISIKNRMCFLKGPMGMSRGDTFSIQGVVDDIMAFNMESSKLPILMFIDSPGGEISAGMLLYDVMKLSRAPITTVGMSCMSMAATILAAGSERLSFEHSRHMLHLPQGTLSGDVEDLKIKTKLIEDMKDELVNTYLECGVHAGLGISADKEEIKRQILIDIDRDMHLTTQDSINYGLVDRVCTSEDLFGDKFNVERED